MVSIPLLPAHSVRDAARAVSRVVGQVIHTVTDAILSEFLDLSEFRVIGYAFEDQGDESIVHLYCAHRHEVALCPRCATVCEEGHQYEDRCVRDLDLLGRRTFLHFPGRRFKCPECGRPFSSAIGSTSAHGIPPPRARLPPLHTSPSSIVEDGLVLVGCKVLHLSLVSSGNECPLSELFTVRKSGRLTGRFPPDLGRTYVQTENEKREDLRRDPRVCGTGITRSARQSSHSGAWSR